MTGNRRADSAKPCRRARSRRRQTRILLNVAAALVVGLLMVALRMQNVGLSYDITQKQRQAQSLSARSIELQAELARLSDPARVGKAAKELGLVEPRPDQIIRLSMREGSSP